VATQLKPTVAKQITLLQCHYIEKEEIKGLAGIYHSTDNYSPFLTKIPSLGRNNKSMWKLLSNPNKRCLQYIKKISA
jgi:hypothetical protein